MKRLILLLAALATALALMVAPAAAAEQDYVFHNGAITPNTWSVSPYAFDGILRFFVYIQEVGGTPASHQCLPSNARIMVGLFQPNGVLWSGTYGAFGQCVYEDFGGWPYGTWQSKFLRPAVKVQFIDNVPTQSNLFPKVNARIVRWVGGGCGGCQ